MATLGIVGFGAIAQSMLQTLCAQPSLPWQELALLVRPARRQSTSELAREICGAQFARVRVVTSIDEMMALAPTLVVECAGHDAVADHAPRLLRAGTDMVIASIGSLADAPLFDAVQDAARAGKAQVILPAGAIGGIDALSAARLSGIQSVVYTGRKPALAWAGTPAEDTLDLRTLTEETVFFEGTAREAARQFPKNANVAATLALAGIGMERTQVRLIADPAATQNLHEYSVSSNAVDYSVRLVGKPSPLNPKTSMATAFSLARAVLNRSEAIVL